MKGELVGNIVKLIESNPLISTIEQEVRLSTSQHCRCTDTVCVHMESSVHTAIFSL